MHAGVRQSAPLLPLLPDCLLALLVTTIPMIMTNAASGTSIHNGLTVDFHEEHAYQHLRMRRRKTTKGDVKNDDEDDGSSPQGRSRERGAISILSRLSRLMSTSSLSRPAGTREDMFERLEGPGMTNDESKNHERIEKNVPRGSLETRWQNRWARDPSFDSHSGRARNGLFCSKTWLTGRARGARRSGCSPPPVAQPGWTSSSRG